MSGRFIGYPTGWILVVVNDPADVVGIDTGLAAIDRFGAWATEEVLPWRGMMPEIPQLMRR